MILAWFNGREAAEVGSALADDYVPRSDSGDARRATSKGATAPMEQLLRRADREVRPLQLNFFQKARFANAFKWRLIEKGTEREEADSVTHALVLHISQPQAPALDHDPPGTAADPSAKAGARQLFNRGNDAYAQGDYAAAAALHESALERDPSLAEALNNLGSSLSNLGRYEEAERAFRDAISLKPDFPDPQANLGVLLRQKSELYDSEALLRRAVKLQPKDLGTRTNLGLTLVFMGRLRDARACFAKVLKAAPRNVYALFGMGQIAAMEGRFAEAESTYRRIMEINPRMTNAWAALPATRKMTNADGDWFKGAEELATSSIHPMEEANMRFALGKYCDDVRDYSRAFQHFKRGNELLKTAADEYDRKERSHFIDALIRAYSAEAVATIGDSGSSSAKPVFVVGMPRSGTSLAEQIIASHPDVFGAGELGFWADLAARDAGFRQSIVSLSVRQEIAEKYLQVLQSFSASSERVIDKAPVNSDFLGLIYSVFPRARVIYLERDPIDTCLSCYFQQFLTGINFSFDLSDLAHYYREHRRIIAHWRSVLPPGFILDVPYESLVAEQEYWSRKMLDFLGLEWDARCLDFHSNRRQVGTASVWQVRQKIYGSSVARWRNYEKFVGPLKALRHG